MSTQLPRHLFQIDLLKGVAILLVLVAHTFGTPISDFASAQVLGTPAPQPFFNITPSSVLSNLGVLLSPFTTLSALTTQQAIPVFLIIMAFNYGLSYQRRLYSHLTDIYTRNELLRRFRRFFAPFLITFIGSLIVGAVLLYSSDKNIFYINSLNLIGILPIKGPGNIFITLIFEFILLFPILYVFYRRKRILTILVSFGIALAFELATAHLYQWSIIYQASIIRFLPTIVLGLWISEHQNLWQKRNEWILFFGFFSVLYLIITSQFQAAIFVLGMSFQPHVASQNLFASFYPALVLLFCISYFPKSAKDSNRRATNAAPNAKLPPLYLQITAAKRCVKAAATQLSTMVLRATALAGKASYHIFLVQIVYFGVLGGSLVQINSLADALRPQGVLLGICYVLLCLGIGIAFYYVENNIQYRKLAYKFVKPPNRLKKG
jgi:peptidoglycan/LPS O-acetylase OafA/YrhL